GYLLDLRQTFRSTSGSHHLAELGGQPLVETVLTLHQHLPASLVHLLEEHLADRAGPGLGEKGLESLSQDRAMDQAAVGRKEQVRCATDELGEHGVWPPAAAWIGREPASVADATA